MYEKRHKIPFLVLAFAVLTVLSTLGNQASAQAGGWFYSSGIANAANSDPDPVNNGDAIGLNNAGAVCFFATGTAQATNADDVLGNNVGSTNLCAVQSETFIVTKSSGSGSYEVGDFISWNIEATNTTTATIPGISIRDNLPAGLTYVAGTSVLSLNTATVSTADPAGANSLQLDWGTATVPAGGVMRVTFKTLVGTGLDIGSYANLATARGPGGTLSMVASGYFSIKPSAVFDCSEVIGRVFDDKNRDGYADAGEEGLAGVRVVSVGGISIKTDKYGRFRVPCAAIPDRARGSNFVLKLDTRTLPTGYFMTSENPRSIRLTRGKMSKLNFGASIHRVVRLDVTDQAWVGNTVQLSAQWKQGVGILVDQLNKAPSILKITYRTQTSGELPMQRLENLAKVLAKAAKDAGATVEIEKEVKRYVGVSPQRTGLQPSGIPQGARVNRARTIVPGPLVKYINGMVYVSPGDVPSGWQVPTNYKLIKAPGGAYYLQDTQSGGFYMTR